MPHTTRPTLASKALETGKVATDVATTQVESFLTGRVCPPNATPIVEEVLFNHALKHTIVYAGRALKELLEGKGLSVTLQYCNSPAHGHPVPFLIARNSDGAFVVPTEVDIREAAGEVDVVALDGASQLTRISPRPPHLKVYTASGTIAYSKTNLRRRQTANRPDTASNEPTAIVIMPATLRGR
jgi:hypothetical protein